MAERDATRRNNPSLDEIPHRDREPLFVHLPDETSGLETLIEEPIGVDRYSTLLESQCGDTDDSQPVEQYEGALGVTVAFVDAHQAPVGQLQWKDNLAAIYNNPGNVSGVRWGTGTLISNDLFLTAGHCFDQTGGPWQRPRDNGTNDIIESTEIATNMHVNFNYQVDPNGNLRQEVSYQVTDLVEYRLGGLDFAIVRLDGNPGQNHGTTQVSTVDPPVNEMVCIIGHPAGLPKRIEAGPVHGYHGDYMEYDTIDTLGGNSGSGILRESDGTIVAVHTLGGCHSIGYNSGVRMSSIVEESPTISKYSKYILEVKINGRGDVLRQPPGLDYSQGEEVTLTATPASGYEFVGWSGDLTGSDTQKDITMDGNKTVTATFRWTCPLAAIAVGSILAPHVNFLRMYRDEVVLKSVFKDHFERILDQYYRFTPRVTRKMTESSLYEGFVKYIITYPFVFLAKSAASTLLNVRTREVGKHTNISFNR